MTPTAGDYMHPDAPLPGSYWNERLVSFSRLKLYSFDGTSFKKPVGLFTFKLFIWVTPVTRI